MQTMRLEILRQAHEFAAHGQGCSVTVRPARSELVCSSGLTLWEGSAERLCAHVSVRLRRVWEGRLIWERGQMVFRVYLIK